MPTPQELFAELDRRLEANPEPMRGLTATYQFNLEGEGGGVWQLRIVDGHPEILEGAPDVPDTTSTLSVQDYVAMATGEVSGRDLFFAGRMRVDGNPMLGMRLGQIMSAP
jgi:putative sterol carrier protein